MILSEDPKSQKLIYSWIDVGVLDYDKKTELYLVHKTDKNGLVRDEAGRPILNGGMTPEGMFQVRLFESQSIALVPGKDGKDII